MAQVLLPPTLVPPKNNLSKHVFKTANATKSQTLPFHKQLVVPLRGKTHSKTTPSTPWFHSHVIIFSGGMQLTWWCQGCEVSNVQKNAKILIFVRVRLLIILYVLIGWSPPAHHLLVTAKTITCKKAQRYFASLRFVSLFQWFCLNVPAIYPSFYVWDIHVFL